MARVNRTAIGPDMAITGATLWIALALGVSSVSAMPWEVAGDGPVDFEGDVRPILESRCYKCHGETKRQGGLRLTNRADAFLPGDSGVEAIVPGDPEASELIYRITSSDSFDQMPPTGDRLSEQQVATLRAWIAEGASFGEADADVQPGADHWAYRAPERPRLPEVLDVERTRNAVDQFVQARLEDESLEPNRDTDRARLLRRTALDLTGLPPKLDEVDRFLQDERPDAFERAVDRLLASPRYGERWARPWLDLARHADSNGFQRDGFREVWPYRDWVVDAINRDLPLDQFVVEQVAGDLLPDATLEQRIATGFLRGNTVNVEAGVDQEENRVLGVVDRIDTLSTAFLGSTFACAQCHNHKYDPFSQQDYYRLFAFFNNTPQETRFRTAGNTSTIDFDGPQITLPIDPGRDRRWQRARQRLDVFRALERTVLEEIRREDPDAKAAKHSVVVEVRATIADLERKADALAAPTSQVMRELKEPRYTYIMIRGDFQDRGSDVEPGVPDVLHDWSEDLPPNRLGLARWLASKENPLLARVTVNRWWLTLFGRGLVETPEDFGTQGAPPTHPGLLDWLASTLMDEGWSRKGIHRRLVLSSTYRRDSRRTSRSSIARDPENTLYARGPRRRLEAEMIRDNALAIADRINLRQGGPPVRPYQPAGVWRVIGLVDNTYRTTPGHEADRRGLYVVWRRSAPYPSFVNFDAPDRSVCQIQRPVTNTPLQALTLLNDPVYVDLAWSLADRIVREAPSQRVEDRSRFAFRLCLAREPRPEELALLVRVHDEERRRLVENPQALDSLVGAGPQVESATNVDPDRAAWFFGAQLLLNLDETITKG